MNRQAMEGRFRRVHRRDWPGFLTHMIPACVWQAFSKSLHHQEHGNTRWTPKYVVEVLSAMGWSMQGTLTERFREAREFLVARYGGRHRPGRTYTGLVEAARELGVAKIQAFWACLRETLPKRVGSAWHWHGWKVFGVDGSREDAPRTRSNKHMLGQSSKAGGRPQFWMTWLVHLATLSLWDWRQGSGDSSERHHLLEMLWGLPAEALVVGDAGFVGFDFLSAIVASGRHFLVRCGSNVRLLIEGCIQEVREEGDHRYVYLWPQGRRDQAPLKLRLIVLKSGPKRMYLLTNVLDGTRLSRCTAAEFYRARWGLEVNYRSFKQTMQRRQVLARSASAGEVELAGAILSMGLLRMHAAIALGARMIHLSVAAALRVIRRALEALRFGRTTLWITAALRTALRDPYRRRSGKAAHDWPHKKRESPPRPPKLRKLTRAQRAQWITMFGNDVTQIT